MTDRVNFKNHSGFMALPALPGPPQAAWRLTSGFLGGFLIVLEQLSIDTVKFYLITSATTPTTPTTKEQQMPATLFQFTLEPSTSDKLDLLVKKIQETNIYGRVSSRSVAIRLLHDAIDAEAQRLGVDTPKAQV